MTKNDFIYALKTSGCLYHNGQTFYEENELIRTFEDMEMFEEDKALSQEPCGDAISREDAIIAINKSYEECEEWRALSDLQYGKNQGLSLAITVIEDLPSVTQKSGKWISVSERLPEEYGEYLITWKNPKYPKTYIGICECEITDVCDHEHNRFEVEWLFDGYIATAYPDSKVIAWMPLPEPYKAESEE